MLKVTIKNAEGQEILSKEGEQEIAFLYERTYEEGDRIVVESSEKNCFLWLQVDEVLGRSMIYLKDAMEYIIPFGEKRLNKSPKAFCGSEHFIWLKRAKEFERKTYRNLALNVNDQSCSTTCYPHVSANVETRGEAVFAAVNGVDGVTANEGHWKWPFQSWELIVVRMRRSRLTLEEKWRSIGLFSIREQIFRMIVGGSRLQSVIRMEAQRKFR